MSRLLTLPLLFVLAPFAAASAQKKPEPAAAPDPSLADLTEFQTWLDDYRAGRIRMMHELQIDAAELDRASALMAKLAAWNSLPALQRLFDAATVDPRAPGERSSTDSIDFRAELQPWRIRAIAREHIASMTMPGLDGWLISIIESKKLRDADENGDLDRRRADAALLVLGSRKNVAAQTTLLQATSRMPPKLRLRALDVLADSGDISLTDTFVRLVGDADPDVRIAAANALGGALREHTDETKDREVTSATAAYRDRAIEALKRLLMRDKIWQVRAAACHALAQLRCKAAIPALIEGYAAELDRKKDPWAMDMRIHGVLEQLTGQSVALGSAQHWRDFWKREGESMRLVTPAEAEKRRNAGKDDRYEKFFALRIESDRVLFVVDFSGSMDEPITLETGTTSTGAGTKTTKARLVVDEMKKIVTSLPDGSYFNIVVFSDEVRVWRPTRAGYPELVQLDDNTRDELLGSFLDNLAPRGPTNLHDALELAVGFAGRGLTDKHYALGFDTIYVLSDGAPSYGKVTDKDEIRRRVRESNRLKRLTIHSVTFGDRNDTDFLRLLAEENGGRHVHVD